MARAKTLSNDIKQVKKKLDEIVERYSLQSNHNIKTVVQLLSSLEISAIVEEGLHTDYTDLRNTIEDIIDE